MGTIRLTIDEKEVTAPTGATIMEAALGAGIEIPHLCYHPKLPPIGSCRVCLVEVEGQPTLVASCTYPAADGMVVRTNTERVLEARRLVLELLLSDHPDDCLEGNRDWECDLARYCKEYGVEGSPFVGERHHDLVDDSNPFFYRQYDKCILCGRCVSICQDIVGAGAIEFAHRGFETRIAGAFGRGLQDTTCVFCGLCVQLCPTGALVERSRAGKGREWEFSTVRTVCAYCGVGCGLVVHLKDGEIIKVEGDEDNPVNRGFTCVKGRFGWDFVTREDRLTTPLVRRNGGLVPATWDDALQLVASNLSRIASEHGADSLAFLTSAKCTNEENYLMQKLARAVVGTNNVDHCARLCHASTVTGLGAAFGGAAMTNPSADLRHAECILVTGSNTTEAHPIIGYEIKAAVKREGATLILADPRKIELADYAAHWLRQRPGSDVALLNAMMNVIIAEGLADSDFIASRTEGYDAFARAVAECTPEWAERLTGVPADAIRAAARDYAKAESAAIVYAMGITQHTTGTDNVLSLANLAMLTGNVGKPSSGVNPLRGQNNVQGACDMGGLPDFYPGYQRVDDAEVRAKFERGWGTSLPEKPGLTVVEMMQAAERGEVRGMVILGENPALSDPDLAHVRKALETLEFVVVIDLFPSETAQYAHVILPAASFLERSGTFTNTERRVQLIRPALAPPGEARADWQILRDLANALGADWRYRSAAEICDELAALTPQYGGMSHARLEQGPLAWPCPTADHPGTSILHVDKFTRGLGKFSAVEFREPAELPDDEYPFTLTTGRLLYHYHTGTLSRRSKGLDAIVPEGMVEIHPEDAGALGIEEGRYVRVTSRRGEVEIPAHVTDRVPPKTVFMPWHFREYPANELTIAALDPQAKIPELKVCAVRVEVVEPARMAEQPFRAIP